MSDNLDNWDNIFAAQQNTTHFSLKKLSKLYRLSDKNNELRRIARMMIVRQHGQLGQHFAGDESFFISHFSFLISHLSKSARSLTSHAIPHTISRGVTR